MYANIHPTRQPGYLWDQVHWTVLLCIFEADWSFSMQGDGCMLQSTQLKFIRQLTFLMLVWLLV